MTTHVISHRKPRGKRGGASLRRFGALGVTVAALLTANAIAPYLYRPASPVTKAPAASPPPVKDAALHVVKVVSIGQAAPVQAAERQPSPRPRRRGVPLDVQLAAPSEDFEILSAAELDAISQARN
jgi:hypothetical protein